MKNSAKRKAAEFLRKKAAPLIAVVLSCLMLSACGGDEPYSSGTYRSRSSDKGKSSAIVSEQTSGTGGGFGEIEQSVPTGSGFSFGNHKFNLVNAVYYRNSETTAILFEGTLNEIAVLVVAAAIGSLENSATYKQKDFKDKIEVIVCMIDTNTGESAAGSSATEGLSNTQITTGEDLTISVSGTLISDKYGESPFSVTSEVTSASIDDIRAKINAYNEFTPSGSGNGGGNTPVKCPSCTTNIGKCRQCKGDGSCHICVAGMSHCLSCNGSRICQYCGGSTICPYCGGDGIMYN